MSKQKNIAAIIVIAAMLSCTAIPAMAGCNALDDYNPPSYCNAASAQPEDYNPPSYGNSITVQPEDYNPPTYGNTATMQPEDYNPPTYSNTASTQASVDHGSQHSQQENLLGACHINLTNNEGHAVRSVSRPCGS